MSKVAFLFLNYGNPMPLFGAIESLLKCNASDRVDIIVVDNFSSLDIRKQILAYIDGLSRKVHVIFNESNLGYGPGNNIGFEFCFDKIDSDIVFTMNPDIVFVNGDLEQLFEVVYLYDSLYTFEVIQNKENITRNYFSENLFYSSSNINKNARFYYPSGCCFGVPKQMWREFGGFADVYFLYFEELDYCYGIKEKLKRFPKLHVFDGISIVHQHGASTGISKAIVHRSLFSEYYSARSRIIFARRHLKSRLPSAVAYNFSLFVHRLISRAFGHAGTILRATKDGIFCKGL